MIAMSVASARWSDLARAALRFARARVDADEGGTETALELERAERELVNAARSFVRQEERAGLKLRPVRRRR